MSVTIYDVAKEAGVGIGTVSRALNNSPNILPETKAKVLRVVKELNYQPYAMAQRLARKKTNTIAAIIPIFTSYFFLEMLKGIQHEVTRHNYDLILYSVDKLSKKEPFLKKTLQERRVDGVLLISLSIPETYVARFLNSRLPIVLVDNFHSELDSITIENTHGAYLATQHLIKLGHTKIGMINGQLHSFPARLRLEGYKKALTESQLCFRNEYLVICDYDNELDGFNKEAGYLAMRKLLELGPDRPSAVFIASDIQAIGAIRAIQEKGLQIPEDIAIVSFDDIELAEYFGLTTMQQPIYAMGKLAVQRLMDKISGKGGELFQKTFQPELIIRQSCGATGEELTPKTLSAARFGVQPSGWGQAKA